MLTFELKGDILEVTETMIGFVNTRVSKVQYDIKKWESRVNNDPFRPMTESAKDWVQLHYFPKVGL